MKNYKIAVAGTGYVGLSIATLLSQHHQVTAVDIVPEKVELINNRKSPIQDDYIEKYLAEKELNLTATLDAKAAFKDKRNGWKSPTAYVKVNGAEKPIKDYVKVFYNRCALRPSCYECPYATTERKTDMTIGDFWHIEETIPDFYDPNGNSLFLIHTNRGEKLFEKIQGDLDYRLSNTTQCWQANLEAPTQKSEQREEFWNDYQKKGIDFVMKKYGTVPMKTKIKNKLLRIMGGGGHRK